MRRMIKSLVALTVLATPVWASAQEWDDIYYNPDKEKKAKIKTPKQQTTVAPVEYAPAGSYSGQWNMGTLRNDDEYNRRVQTADSLTADSLAGNQDNFEYTRRIERFHNPDVVVETGNEDLVDWYYNQSENAQSVVVVNVNTDPWWTYPYYNYRSWYRPYGWYSGYWGPSWSWSWGYDPWYSWAWGPSYGWGWGPSYGWGWTHGPSWGWAPHPGRPVAGGWRPSTPGASRPHGVPVTSGRGHYAGNNSRPGNMGRPSGSGSHVSSSAWMRPGNVGQASTSHSRPNSSAVSNARPGNSGNRTNHTTDYNSSSSRYNNSSSSSSSSRPSYNSGSSYGGSHRSGAGSSMGGRGGSSHGGGGRGGRR